jgi:hypothetical protein
MKLVFGFSHGPLARAERIWRLFAFMDVPRRIVRERVPTMGARPYSLC